MRIRATDTALATMLTATTATPEPLGTGLVDGPPIATATQAPDGRPGDRRAVAHAAIVSVVALSFVIARARVSVSASGSVVERVVFLLPWVAATPGILGLRPERRAGR